MQADQFGNPLATDKNGQGVDGQESGTTGANARLPPTRRRTVLLSIFACSPVWGSEPGVGWRWALELSLRFRVIVLTHGFFREQIEQPFVSDLLSDPRRELAFHYFTPFKLGLHPHTQLNSRAYYTLWQWRARAVVAALCRETPIDLIHHLTWGTYRFPVFLGGAVVPLVLGPLGGGDVAPQRLYEGLPTRERWREATRAFSLRLSRLDPFTQAGLRRATLIFCKTEETRRAIGPAHREKAHVAAEIGAPEVPESVRARLLASGTDLDLATESRTPAQPFRLLYAGRLIGLKGVMLLLGTMKILCDRGRSVELWLAGDGSLRSTLEEQVRALGIAAQVRFLGSLERAALMDLYSDADVFFFPSLHDSSGNVVLEALSRGLPVLCLDLGGPKYYVNPECGIVIETAGLQRTELDARFADAIESLMDDPKLHLRMKQAAVEHASVQTWSACVWGVYSQIEKTLAWSSN